MIVVPETLYLQVLWEVQYIYYTDTVNKLFIISSLIALPHQCVVVPEPGGGSGAFRFSACDPVTGALAYYGSYFDEPTTDCNNDILRTTSYPKCGQLNVLAGTAWGFNDCQLNLTAVGM
jgi:hypothetical protein